MWSAKGETYQRANADAEVGRRANDIANRAVGSSDNGVAVDEGSTADVAAADLERGNEGELASRSSGSANNVLLRSIIPLGSRSSRDERGKGNGEDNFETHGDWLRVLLRAGVEATGYEETSDWMSWLMNVKEGKTARYL